MANVIVAPQVRDLETLASQLSAWMRSKLSANAVELSNLAYPFGAGQSHETILFDAAWTEGGRRREQGFVVRIKPTRHIMFPVDLFEEQYRLMHALHELGNVKVARTFWYETDPSILGAPFFVMEKKRGRVAVSVPPYAREGWVVESTPAQRRKMWENGVRQLAAIQSTPLDQVQFLAAREGPRDGLEQEWAKYVRFVEWHKETRPVPLYELALEKLRARWPKNQPAGVVWGDARLGNIMFDENYEVVAVMDWEQPSLGGALNDLAWWVTLGAMMHCDAAGRPFLEGLGSREDAIAIWKDITGISTDDLEWYEDFTRLKLACLSVRMSELRGAPIPTQAWDDSPTNRMLAERLEIPWGG
jgi:aminoglycoside phosphotransferase (APT) family kinase protein